MKRLITITIFLLIIRISASHTLAFDPISEQSAVLSEASHTNFDYRSEVLEKYLKKHNSPLTNYADEFVYSAEKYDLDWRLVPAISGVESTFGKRIPHNSYNAYGWSNGNYSFESWEQSIEVVSQTLREKYIDDGLTTLSQISRRYAPPSPSWAWKVEYFQEKIDPIPLEFTL